jgi:hypothetical protein
MTKIDTTHTARAKRRLGIQQALEWAFGREKAQLDLGVLDPQSHRGAAVGAEWVIWQRFMLGATVDQSGAAFGGSAPHSDAEVIAAFVAALPDRSMATMIAARAAAGMPPDCMQDARVHCVPRDWRQTRYGWFARREDVPKREPNRWPSIEYEKSGRRKRTVVIESTWCPVTYTPTQAQIAAARRGYMDWWGALLALAADLRNCRMLGTVEITTAMPPMTPWSNACRMAAKRKGVDKKQTA